MTIEVILSKISLESQYLFYTFSKEICKFVKIWTYSNHMVKLFIIFKQKLYFYYLRTEVCYLKTVYIHKIYITLRRKKIQCVKSCTCNNQNIKFFINTNCADTTLIRTIKLKSCYLKTV